MQIDKLVQLLESPVFVLLRLQVQSNSRPSSCLGGAYADAPTLKIPQLLDPSLPCYPDLLKSLYGRQALLFTNLPFPPSQL
jgi:hypothetical protein